jgi:hypothetical protein
MQRGLYQVQVEGNQLRAFVDAAALKLSQDQIRRLSYALRDTAARVQARAVRNVSGYPVRYDGQTFRVVVRTGALKGAIEMQWPYQSPLQARVFVNGAHTAQPFQMGDQLVKPRPVAVYAAAIEFGHGPIDLKQSMMGKTVPFFASRSSSSTGPYAARGVTETADGQWENKALNNRLQARGKAPMYFGQRKTTAAYEGAKGGAASYFIAFRKVGKTGWVIPEAKPRPFMRAAVRQSERDMRSLIFNGLKGILTDAGRS